MANPFADTDPFTLVHQRIWTVITEKITDAGVKPGNQIDITAAEFRQFKPESNSADFPEVEIGQAAFSVDLYTNSKAGTLHQTYLIWIATDTLKVVTANKVKWSIVQALYQAGDRLGLDYVRNAVFRSCTDTESDLQRTRGTTGYVAMMAVDVEIMVPKDSLLA